MKEEKEKMKILIEKAENRTIYLMLIVVILGFILGLIIGRRG